MVDWLIHMEDGETVTDVLPHKLSAYGYTQNQITSVERIIEGRHLTIKKSLYLENYFMMVDAGITLQLFSGGPKAGPPKVALKNIGGYVKDSMVLTEDETPRESHLQFRYGMHPKTGDVNLEFLRVNKVTPTGINVKRIYPLVKGVVRFVYQHIVDEFIYSVYGSRDVAKAEVEDNKFIITLTNGRIATIISNNGNATLEII